jgi:hypothetical protein
MPIEITCSCGKRLQVGNEFAGRQGQCPACGALLLIRDRDATVPASSPETAQAANESAGLDNRFGPGWLECGVTPAAGAPGDSPDVEGDGSKENENVKLTAVGCVLTLLSVAVIFGVAIPIVRWRDPLTREPLPRIVAIIAPLLIGATVNGIASLLLKLVGLPSWSKQAAPSRAAHGLLDTWQPGSRGLSYGCHRWKGHAAKSLRPGI